MKKLNHVWAVLPLTFFVLSCNEDGPCIKGEGDVETRVIQVASFDGVRVNGDTEVYITKGQALRVEVQGEPNILNELTTEVTDKVLYLDFDRCIRRHKTVKVFITTPEFNYAEVNGSGLVVSDDLFVIGHFRSRISGSGRIRARVDADRVSAGISGSGTVTYAGSADNQTVNISGSGELKAFDLETKNTEVTVSGSGNSEVTVTDALDVEISGSGRVYYKGNPTIRQSTSGSGKVIKS